MMLHKSFIGLCLLFISLVIVSTVDGKVHAHGYWTAEDTNQHVTDYPLADGLVDFFKKENAGSVVDLGCGKGHYVKVFRFHNIQADGYDGNPDTEQLSGGVAKVADLTEDLDLKQKYDWVMSLEVGEHIPKKFETAFIDNLDKNNIKGVVLSWAVKGQGGYGHFNEQNNDTIKALMADRGYVNDLAAENELRKHASLWWFKNTVMVFRRPEDKIF